LCSFLCTYIWVTYIYRTRICSYYELHIFIFCIFNMFDDHVSSNKHQGQLFRELSSIKFIKFSLKRMGIVICMRFWRIFSTLHASRCKNLVLMTHINLNKIDFISACVWPLPLSYLCLLYSRMFVKCFVAMWVYCR
jgi:hypothetical protein